MRAAAYRTAARLLLIPMLLLFFPALLGIALDYSVRGLSALAQRWHKIADKAPAQGSADRAALAAQEGDA